MKINPYTFQYDQERLLFIFESVSEFKMISKIVSYDSFPEKPELYNLFLGDILPNGSASDLSLSNNEDMEKILATVVHTMLLFFESRPENKIYFTGSTSTRTRLYRIAISNYRNEFEEYFVIEGVFENGTIEPFENDKKYIGFIISLKS